jgi:hypothetical protein
MECRPPAAVSKCQWRHEFGFRSPAGAWCGVATRAFQTGAVDCQNRNSAADSRTTGRLPPNGN